MDERAQQFARLIVIACLVVLGVLAIVAGVAFFMYRSMAPPDTTIAIEGFTQAAIPVDLADLQMRPCNVYFVADTEACDAGMFQYADAVDGKRIADLQAKAKLTPAEAHELVQLKRVRAAKQQLTRQTVCKAEIPGFYQVYSAGPNEPIPPLAPVRANESRGAPENWAVCMGDPAGHAAELAANGAIDVDPANGTPITYPYLGNPDAWVRAALHGFDQESIARLYCVLRPAPPPPDDIFGTGLYLDPETMLPTDVYIGPAAIPMQNLAGTPHAIDVLEHYAFLRMFVWESETVNSVHIIRVRPIPIRYKVMVYQDDLCGSIIGEWAGPGTLRSVMFDVDEIELLRIPITDGRDHHYQFGKPVYTFTDPYDPASIEAPPSSPLLEGFTGGAGAGETVRENFYWGFSLYDRIMYLRQSFFGFSFFQPEPMFVFHPLPPAPPPPPTPLPFSIPAIPSPTPNPATMYEETDTWFQSQIYPPTFDHFIYGPRMGRMSERIRFYNQSWLPTLQGYMDYINNHLAAASGLDTPQGHVDTNYLNQRKPEMQRVLDYYTQERDNLQRQYDQMASDLAQMQAYFRQQVVALLQAGRLKWIDPPPLDQVSPWNNRFVAELFPEKG